MRQFFEQFGVVTNLRLGRSKKTGKSCGFAFVEFKYMEVAEVTVCLRVTEPQHYPSHLDRLGVYEQLPDVRQNFEMFSGDPGQSQPRHVPEQDQAQPAPRQGQQDQGKEAAQRCQVRGDRGQEKEEADQQSQQESKKVEKSWD